MISYFINSIIHVNLLPIKFRKIDFSILLITSALSMFTYSYNCMRSGIFSVYDSFCTPFLTSKVSSDDRVFCFIEGI